jgi:hypothetical protein
MASRLHIFAKFTEYLNTLSDVQKKTDYNKRLGEAMRLHELAQASAFDEEDVYEPLKANANSAADALSVLMTSGGGRRRSSCKSSRRRHRRSRRASRRAH